MTTSWKRTAFVGIVVLAAGTCFALIAGCGGNDIRSLEPNAQPAVISFTPSFLVAGAAMPQTIIINGTGFVASTSVAFNGAQRPVTLVSSTQISIALVQADLAVPGNYGVSVTNPSPGGGVTTGTFSVWQPMFEPSTGLNFAVPPFGATNRISVDTSTPQQTFINFKLQDGTGTFVPELSLTVFGNPNGLSLSQWFEENVDVNGILLSNNAYQEETLSDNSSAFVFTGTIPDQFYAVSGGPPLDNAYKMLGSGQVVGIAQSQVDDLSDYGYPTPQELSELQLQVLATVHF